MSAKRILCECPRRNGGGCPNWAKWVTPKHRFHYGGLRVCGVHKSYFETLFAKAKRL